MRRILVLAAHFDDEAIGCGGAVLSHLEQGDAVRVVFATDGASGAGGADSDERRREAADAWADKGVGMANLGFPDGFLKDYEGEVVKVLTEIIRNLRPTLIYAPHTNDRNRDHVALGEATAAATLMADVRAWEELGTRHGVEELRFYEVWEPISYSDIAFALDISTLAVQKRQLIASYHSQVSRRNYADGALGLNQYRATQLGVGQYAEVFSTLRPSVLTVQEA